ncbi:MAG: methyltransferase domain-containing protein, partial [Microlunatus sp.]|nr:methyltransferase domain-containing protein [Microlunatus sp.]
MGWPDRYASVAAAYDLVSGEPVYRLGRQVGIDALDLRPGDRVLDIGCGTGLNFELLKQSIGADGRIVGVDLSAQMLAQAARRVERREWGNVILVRANVETLAETDLSGSDLSGSDLSGSDRSGADLAHAASVTAFPAFDAVLFTRHATPSAPLGSTPGSAGLCAMPKGADLRAVLDDGLACGLAARAR